ncbi:MAG: TRAP transporter small permease [Arenicella sp.]
MLTVEKSVNFIFQFTKWNAIAGVGALVIAILMVIVDIIWRRIFSEVFLGTVDITQLCVMVAAFWSIPYAFSEGAHVSVDLLSGSLPKRMLKVFEILASLIGLLVMTVILFLSCIRAMEQYSYGDSSLNLAIPMIFYWFFLLSGCFFSCLVLFAQIVSKVLLFVRD